MNRGLRVLHVIPSISPSRGGPGIAILPMVRALRECGVEAEIATTDDDGAGVREAVTDEWTMVEGVPVRFFRRFSSPLRAVREYAYGRGFRNWLREHLGDYDLLHIHALFSHLPTTTMRMARAAEVPYVARPLGLLGRWPLQQSAWRKRIYLAMGERANLRGAAAVHFTSMMEEEEAAALGWGLRGVIIPHGMDLPVLIPEAKIRLREKFGLTDDRKLVLFLGRLHKKKGLDLLLEAMVDGKDFTLIIAGRGEAAFEIELGERIRSLGLEERVLRSGFVTGEEKRLLLQGADVFALTSQHENFGIAVAEALAAGSRVLISDQVALAKEVTEHLLGTVVPLQVEAARQGLNELLAGDPDANRERLRKFVAIHCSWERNARASRQLYLTILQRTTSCR